MGDRVVAMWFTGILLGVPIAVIGVAAMGVVAVIEWLTPPLDVLCPMCGKRAVKAHGSRAACTNCGCPVAVATITA